MGFEKTYLPVVESIYDAAVDPSRWSAALERLAAPTGGKGFIVIHDPVTAAGSCTVFANWEDSWIDVYNEYYAGRNAWLARVAKRPVGKAEPSEFFLDRSDLLKTEWYNDFLQPQELITGLGVTVMRDHSRFVTAGALIPRCSDANHAAHVALLQRVTPHLERALQVNRQLSGANFRWQAAAECFNRLQVGVVLVGSGLGVQFANAAAQLIFRQQDGLGLDREGRLLAAGPDDNARLRQSLHGLVTAAGAERHGVGGVLSIHRRSGRRPYGILVAGVRPPSELFGPAGSMAIVFISDGAERRQLSAERLAEAFDLTPAEARLLKTLMRGHSLTEAAAHLGISGNTAKSQLKGLFDKLGCSRQADLVRTVMSHPAWLAGR